MSRPAPGLPGFIAAELPFARRMIGDIHFVDHGEGAPVLMVHGNPTWCFLWRKVIARLGLSGVRAIAPDLLGCGLSAKLSRPDEHTIDRHCDAIAELVVALDLKDVTIVGQDWGGPISAGVAMRLPDRVRAAVFANTSVLPVRRPF